MEPNMGACSYKVTFLFTFQTLSTNPLFSFFVKEQELSEQFVRLSVNILEVKIEMKIITFTKLIPFLIILGTLHIFIPWPGGPNPNCS
jgi:hypothetical protein